MTEYSQEKDIVQRRLIISMVANEDVCRAGSFGFTLLFSSAAPKKGSIF
jgi:hypothetical protein